MACCHVMCIICLFILLMFTKVKQRYWKHSIAGWFTTNFFKMGTPDCDLQRLFILPPNNDILGWVDDEALTKLLGCCGAFEWTFHYCPDSYSHCYNRFETSTSTSFKPPHDVWLFKDDMNFSFFWTSVVVNFSKQSARRRVSAYCRQKWIYCFFGVMFPFNAP